MIDKKTARQPARVAQVDAGKVYDSLAWFYDIWGWATERRARTRVLELAQIQNGESVLEIAVGTGVAFEKIVQQNSTGRNIGIDISTGMLEQAKKRMANEQNGNYTLQTASALDLPFDDHAFDLVLNNYMFDLLAFDEMDQVLEEIKRVLKPRGRLVFASMTFGERFGSGIYERIYQLSPKLMGGCRGVRMSEKVKKHGFEIVSREYHQQVFFPSEVILARK